ncbi:hypothetical protein RJ639_035367 [Escallonia herrerae]|uniref:Protein kinase domain-containing protein n=1 Tax=Escallonia herrerae TaxID=1293975 RepID=A0AA88WU40_9ASTE|nr:hypothetical protein RJ639_035367 [Escallonia herrerae]
MQVTLNSDTKPTSKVQRNHSSISNSILPDKDGAMSNSKDGVLAQELPSGGQTPTPSFKQFTFTELKSITKNFSNERILSKGFHVVAFKGWIDEKTYNPSEFGVGMTVVVKKITPNEFQDPGLRQILELLRKCSHPNLVKLLGYYTESEYSGDCNMFLVHEYMQKGSLDNHLFRKGAVPLSWPIRLKIAIGAARGLAFLHTMQKQNMYSKFETLDILLDKLLTGRRVDDSSPPSSESNLVSWARPYLTEKRWQKNIMDARLNDEYPPRGASKVALLAQSCLAYDPEARPSMEEVLEALRKVSAI